MRSRVHPTFKTRYRVTNWAEHDRALINRGDITLWISPDAVKSWVAKPLGRWGWAERSAGHRELTAR